MIKGDLKELWSAQLQVYCILNGIFVWTLPLDVPDLHFDAYRAVECKQCDYILVMLPNKLNEGLWPTDCLAWINQWPDDWLSGSSFILG